ncbi:MAG: serine/threonine protein kinase [Chloroflexi bacterium]|nr:serine/threonine protein kinase [Chloroflexota bacterium]
MTSEALVVLRKVDSELQGIRPGTSIGPYLIHGSFRHGRGGMAYVFKASLKSNPEERVALKISRFDSATSFNPLIHEATVLQHLDHPGIIRLLPIPLATKRRVYVARALEIRGQPWFLAMEYLSGGSLDTHLRHVKRMGVEQAATLAFRVALALDYLHSQGFAHLDVKPGNILFRQELPMNPASDTVLVDFALAARKKDRFEAGTPAFMSPERWSVVRGEQAPESLTRDPAMADVFSLGVVLYRAVTGRLPFQGFTEGSIRGAILRHTAERPISIIPQLPQRIDELIMSCLEKDPRLRPSAAEVAGVLEAFANEN